MKLVRLGAPGRERLAVVVEDDTALDVSAHHPDIDAAFFAQGGVDALRRLIESGGTDLPRVALDGVRIGPCIPRPCQIIGIGLNYADHARESAMDIPTQPVVFSKAPNSLSGPYDPVLIPPRADKMDWEVELGVVIGQRAQHLPDEAAAAAAIAGYCVVNDVSERGFQLEHDGQWMKGKSSETFCPTGPWLVTADEVSDPQDLALHLDVNGLRMQEGSTRAMVFPVRYLVWYLSQYLVLEPGDLIATGTPFGVGMGMDPPRFLAEDDTMKLGITGLGEQRQTCRHVESSRGATWTA